MGVPVLSNVPEQWKRWEGRVLDGRFRLQQYLAGAGHSAVFLTEHGEASQKAVVKLVAADPAQAQFLLARWKRSAALSNDHLIRLFEMGQSQLDDMPICYVVMECVEEDLSQILPQRALTPLEATEMLRQAVNAIAYLHARGLIHGRIKPSNILALGDQIKLSSDSIGSKGDPDPLDNSGIYDAPEKSKTGLSSASDIWSLGVTLVESLTQSPAAWELNAQGEPTARQTLPAPFHEIARHCLHRDPQRRWSIDAIASALQSPPSSTEDAVPADPEKTKSAKRFAVPIMASIVIVAIWVGLRQRHSEAEPPAQQAAVQSMEQKPAATTPSQAPVASETAPPAAGDAAGSVLYEVLPKVSPSARRTIQGTVKVRVKASVDASGNVTGTSFESAGPSQYFARLSTEAARKWKFVPTQVNGQNVASKWTLRFEYSRTQTRSVPQRIRP